MANAMRTDEKNPSPRRHHSWDERTEQPLGQAMGWNVNEVESLMK